MLIRKIEYEESNHGGHCDSHNSIVAAMGYAFPNEDSLLAIGVLSTSAVDPERHIAILNADSRGRMKRGRQLRRPYFCEGGLVQ